jgi:hypothetical protein
MNTLRNIALISSLAFSSALFAATEFPNDLVPADIAEKFSQGKIYSSLPDGFPVPILPAGTNLYVLGSVDHVVSQRLLLGTTLTGNELRELLKAGYAPGGWLDLSRFPDSLDLCHDTLGRLSFRMDTPAGNENRVLATRSSAIAMSPESMSCAEQLAYQNGGPPTTPYAVFQDEVPQLKVPLETTNSGPTLPFGSVSSSSGASGVYYEREQDSTLTIPDYSLAELHEHFAQQLMEEGWQQDTDSIGVRSTTAVWFKSVMVSPSSVAGRVINMTAVMTLLETLPDTYRVVFTVHSGNRAGSGIISIGGLGSN